MALCHHKQESLGHAPAGTMTSRACVLEGLPRLPSLLPPVLSEAPTPAAWAPPPPHPLGTCASRLPKPLFPPACYLQHLQPPKSPEGAFLDAADLVLVQLSVKQREGVQRTARR